MRIVYVAKHGPRDNQDEDAITFALQEIGHEVITVQETYANRAGLRGDMLLFHSWQDTELLHKAQCARKIFWHFDLMSSMDPTIQSHMERRRAWLQKVLPLTHLGFMTDGDTVAQDITGKLVWLAQGADERVVGPGLSIQPKPIDILMTGRIDFGGERTEFMQKVLERYGNRVTVVGGTVGAPRIHGRALADLIASSKIVMAPEGLSTDYYWSNRVYLTLGFGGLLLHPYCSELCKQYLSGVDFLTYRGFEDFCTLTDAYLNDPTDTWRKDIAKSGYKHTIKHHLYRHRVEQMLQVIRERL